MKPSMFVRILLFFFVGGLVGIGYELMGGSMAIVPLVILLAGLGAVGAVGFFLGEDN